MSETNTDLIQKLKDSICATIQGAIVDVTTDGYYYHIHVTAAAFADYSLVKQQQLVYQGINDLITSGAVHAVKIKTSVK